MKTSIAILGLCLALTVFLTSLVLETKSSPARQSRIDATHLDAVLTDGEALIDQLSAPASSPGSATAVRAVPQSRSDELLAKGHHFRRCGNLSGAIELYESVLELEPAHAEALSALGVACFSSQRYAEAETHIRRLIEVSTTADCMVRMRLAVSQMRQAKYGPALDNLRIVLLDDPEDAGVHFALACVYSELTETNRGLYHLELAYARMGATILAHISDPHLNNLRRTKRFHRIVRSARSRYSRGAMVSSRQPVQATQ
ncbi:MAG: tetratricopeptide repeat protein [Lentisphaerae bacterium]|nr:tetratricopeptide repeat protein [Lentisphaerota bacterium]MBT7060082.1 tetratricopeptide repeat protein [Lentisphaerota bacterium]MBT7840858.1 tetratricopeptide repeat protein [Lentisphaerota bacterium]